MMRQEKRNNAFKEQGIEIQRFHGGNDIEIGKNKKKKEDGQKFKRQN